MDGAFPGHILSNAAERIVLFLRVNGPIFIGVNNFDSIVIFYLCIVDIKFVEYVSNEQIFFAISFILWKFEYLLSVLTLSDFGMRIRRCPATHASKRDFSGFHISLIFCCWILMSGKPSFIHVFSIIFSPSDIPDVTSGIPEKAVSKRDSFSLWNASVSVYWMLVGASGRA